MLRYIIVLAVVFVAREVAAQCDAKYQKIPKHTACLPKSKKATSVEWTAEDKQSIVDQHNALRATVQPSATNMMKMEWDDELAMIAQKWADACEARKTLKHDKHSQRSLGPYGMSSGQNGAGTVDYTTAINMWWAENEDYAFGTDYNSQTAMIGHYTQMAWAKTYRVGCGAATCTGKWKGQFLYCNYGPAGNMLPFSKPYNDGESGKECKTATNGLCDCNGLNCNSGKLIPGRCECDCSMYGRTPSFLKFSDCHFECEGTTDHFYCKWYKDCKQSMVKQMCPHQCGVCLA